MTTLGERLKKARQDADLSLKKFADISKIQIKYLESLEEGQFNRLPAFVYIQGFLKKYSQNFNLPFEELLAQYEREAKEQILTRAKAHLKLPAIKSPKIIITPARIKWLVVILIVILVVGYLVYQLDFLIAPPALSLIYPAEDLTLERSSIVISGQADASAKLTVNGTQVYIDNDGHFEQEINLSPGVNVLKIEAENRFGKKSELIRNIVVK